MKKILVLAGLLLPGFAGAVTPINVERAPGAPSADPASERMSCSQVPSPLPGRPDETVCLTPGQRAAQVANAAALSLRPKPATTQPAPTPVAGVPQGR